MGGIKLGIHPLFYVFGLYYALTSRVFIFIIYTITAVVHELGHSFVASSIGYKLSKITLMPFGAVVKGNIDGASAIDELKIAFAGPFINIAIGLLFVAFWWVYPESYAFTDVVVQANFSLALVNFLPIYPLDGGRIFSALLSLKLNRQTADKICTATGLVFAVMLFGLFVASIFYTLNISLLFFSVFVIVGLFGKDRENKYVRLFSVFDAERLKRGVLFKKYAVDKSITVKKMLSILDVTCINEIAVFDGNMQIATFSQQKITKIAEKGELYSPIYKYITI